MFFLTVTTWDNNEISRMRERGHKGKDIKIGWERKPVEQLRGMKNQEEKKKNAG